jgi:hypothetical protein
MIKFLWVLTLLCALLAGVGIAATALLAQSAPAQAAGAALSLGVAIVPYIFTRAAQELSR